MVPTRLEKLKLYLSCAKGSSSSVQAKAEKWSAFLKAPLNPVSVDLFTHQLLCFDEGLRLVDLQGRKLEINFDQNHLDYKRKHRGKNELLAKALGAAKGFKNVLDLSVGMGIDSVFLTQLGFQVTGVERSPLLFALLSEAFENTQQSILASYRLHHCDSFDFLSEQKNILSMDAIYFDPMYPHNKKKTALPKQEMVVFRDIVGHDEDAKKVLEAALQWRCQRVVVKRPLQAEELLPGVTHAFEGKLIRYDTYIVRD